MNAHEEVFDVDDNPQQPVQFRHGDALKFKTIHTGQNFYPLCQVSYLAHLKMLMTKIMMIIILLKRHLDETSVEKRKHLKLSC